MDTFQSGALVDERTEDKKIKDYRLEEAVVKINPVNWVEKPQSEWRKFPIFNQDGSGSCVAQTMAKLLGVLYWLKNNVYVHFSATHIYQRRENKSTGGMGGVNAFDIAREGVTLEELVPSQDMNDEQMDSIQIPQYKKDVGSIFKVPNYLTLPIKDIDTIASVIDTTGKAVMIWFYFENREWTERPVVLNPNLVLTAPETGRHSVAGVDFTLYQGKKAIVIDDSWGSKYGLVGQRIIDEDFFKARNWFAAYPINFSFDSTGVVKPQYTFNKDLQFGMNDEDIVVLQNILKYEGFYPVNISSTGYFGAITKTAVQKFQDKFIIAHAGDPGYGRVGPITRAKLNQIYG